MRKKKKTGNKVVPAVLVTSAAVLVLCGFWYWHGDETQRAKEYEENAARVAALETGDVSAVLRQLEDLESRENPEAVQETGNTEEGTGVADIQVLDTVALKKAFSGSVIVGDSITESIVEYGYLDSDVVISKRGLSISAAEEQFQTAIALAPEAVFLAFGSNDLELYEGNTAAFKEAYVEKVGELKEALPDVPIYVNSILPIQQSAIDEIPALAYYGEFNQALEETCQELDCTFIDNAPLVAGDDEIYEPDGEHVKANYYPRWLTHMAETAGLV